MSLWHLNWGWRGFISRIVCIFIPSSDYRRKFQELIGYRHKRVVREKYGQRKIHHGGEAQALIGHLIKSGQPCMIGRFGTVEFSVAHHYLRNASFRKNRDTAKLLKAASINAGFFPPTPEMLARLAVEAFGIVNHADVIGVWNGALDGEEYVVNICASKASLIGINELNPIHSDEPWSQYLEGKKVLVIHPFEKSIVQQYEKREKLFSNPKILPEFELKILKPVQSIAGNYAHLPYNDWFEALESILEEISAVDFDIALIAAGAYGMFLADYCKSIGKQSVYMGSFLQIMFGICGKRWIDEGATFINEHWVRPLPEETPPNVVKVERGCYW
ncbi:MAG: hypothetical protein ACN4GW_03690 [Desulforhopalus sp.]